MTEDDRRPPLYARVLRLRHVRPSGFLCFLFFEGALAISVLLALAELVPWVAVPVLPIVVAVMVKLTDLLAGLPTARQPATEPAVPRGRMERLRRREVRHVSRDLSDSMDPVDSPRQRFRQSARRRYG
jgi:hypothetical protein